MKVALICPTVGQTRRGYERFLLDLKQRLAAGAEITLFKGAGESKPGEKVVPHLRRAGFLHRWFPNRLLYARYQLEFASFALALFPHLLRGDFDLVHFIDPPLGRFLHAFRRLTRGRYRLLFTNGGTVPYDCSGWADHIHCVTPAALAATRDSGLSAERLTLLPPGIDPGRLHTPLDSAELRRRYGVPESAFVILSVTTLNRLHKRVDYLIEEVAQLPGDVLLWLEGSLHPDGDPALLELAARRLGNRFRHTHVRSEQVGELYKAADLLVSSALHESFGMAIVEALISGLPVVIHDSPHFRWLAGAAANFVDMRSAGTLAARLAALLPGRARLRHSVDPADVLARFAWENLVPGYLAMYRRAAASAFF